MTVADANRFLEYVGAKKTNHGKVCTKYGITFDELSEFLIEFIKLESERTSEPNYKAMYEEAVAKNEDLALKFKDLETTIRIKDFKLARYAGAIDAIEVLTSRKFGFNQCGGNK